VKKRRSTEEPMVHALRQAEAGTPAVEVRRKLVESVRASRPATGMNHVRSRREASHRSSSAF
jgi:hypothetical protein